MRTDGRTDGEKAAKGSSISRPLPPSLSITGALRWRALALARGPPCLSLPASLGRQRGALLLCSFTSRGSETRSITQQLTPEQEVRIDG